MIKRVYTAFAQEDRSQVDWGLFFTLIFYPSWHLGAAPTFGSGVIAISAAPRMLPVLHFFSKYDFFYQ